MRLATEGERNWVRSVLAVTEADPGGVSFVPHTALISVVRPLSAGGYRSPNGGGGGHGDGGRDQPSPGRTGSNQAGGTPPSNGRKQEITMGKVNYAKYDPRVDSSEGAEAYWSDPDAPEGSEEAAGFYPWCTLILVADKPGDCPCGCRQAPVGKNRVFRMGHDARLRGKLIRAHVAGFEVAQVGPGLLISGPAMTVAHNLGWDHYLEEAARREIDRKANRVSRANRQVLDNAVNGPRVGDSKLIRVGRWDYTGNVVAVWDDGDTIDYEYVTKSGAIKHHTEKKGATK